VSDIVAFEMEFMDKQGNMIKLAIRCQLFFKDDTQVQHAPSFTPRATWVCVVVDPGFLSLCAGALLGDVRRPGARLEASAVGYARCLFHAYLDPMLSCCLPGPLANPSNTRA